MNSRSSLALLFGAAACVLGLPAAASANATLTAFSVTPTTTQAGGHPDLKISQTFSVSPGSDDVKDTTVRLARGIVGNPKATPKCSSGAFAADTCPANTAIGSVQVTAQALGSTVVSDGTVYNLPPAGPEPARLGIKVRPAPLGIITFQKISLIGVAKLGPETGYALETTFANQPRTVTSNIGPIDLTVQKIDLTLKGTPGATPFTINPSSCSAATSTATINSYEAPGASSTRSSSFTPTGCGSLPFKPQVSGTIGKARFNKKGALVPLTTVFAFPSGSASLKDSIVTLPLDVTSNLDALSKACPALTPVAQCPSTSSIGSAKAISPLLDKPLTGPVILQRSSGPLPKLVVRLGGAVPLTLVGQSDIVANRLKTTFAPAPDTPLSRFELKINGGKKGLLQAVDDLCRKGPKNKASVVLTGYNGARYAKSVGLKPAGCKGYKPPRPGARASLKGKRLKIRVAAGRYTRVKRVVATLPRGVRVSRKGLRVRASAAAGSKITARAKGSGARTLTISAKRVGVSRRLIGKRIKVKLAISDNYRRTVHKTVKVRVRR